MTGVTRAGATDCLHNGSREDSKIESKRDAAGVLHVEAELLVPRERVPSADLREAGEAALLRHLDAEVGATRRVLIELNRIGRTEAFTPVRFSSAVERGDLRPVTITGHNGRELLAA